MRKVLCPDCKKHFPEEGAKECEVYCEDCGDHGGLVCPHCGECVDMVFAEVTQE